MCVRIRELYQVDLPLRSFFETPTVAELAEKIRAGAGTDADDVVPVRRERPVEELLAEIEGLSDEQVASAVAAMDAER